MSSSSMLVPVLKINILKGCRMLTLRLWKKKNAVLQDILSRVQQKTVHVVYMVKAMPKGRGNISEGQSLAVARLLTRFS